MRRVVNNPIVGVLIFLGSLSLLATLTAQPAKTSFADSTWIETTVAGLGYSIERPPSSTAVYYLPEEILQIEILPDPAVVTIRAFENPDALNAGAWADKYLLDPVLRGTSTLVPPLPTAERKTDIIGGQSAEIFLVHGPIVTIQRTVIAHEQAVFILDHEHIDGDLALTFDQIVKSISFGEFSNSEGAMVVETELTEDISALPVPLYKQRDPRWTCDQIGSCWCYLGNCWGHTGIGDAGCYITAESMIFDYYTGGYMDPQELDTCLTNNGGYGLWQGCGWGLCATTYNPISACSPSEVTYEGLASSRSLLDEDLENGYPVIAWVDGGVHYLVIIGKENGRYLVNDPLYARTSIYSGEIIYYVRLHGSPATTPPLDTSLQSGFPAPAYRTPGAQFEAAFQHILVANLDGDPTLEIASSALGYGPLLVWDADGSLASPAAQGVSNGQAFHAAGKFSNIPQALALTAGYGNGMIHSYHIDGSTRTGWPAVISPGGADPALADVDGDGLEESFYPTGDGKIQAFHPDGSLLSGWPIASTSGRNFSTPALADIDQDGDVEVIALDQPSNGTLSLYGYAHTGAILPGFPVVVAGSAPTVPVVGDVDGDLQNEIIVAAAGSGIQIFSLTGVLENSITQSGSISRSTAPALADLDNDEIPEIIVQGDYSLYAWKGDGTLFPGWPDSWGSDYVSGRSSPVIGDVNGDGEPDIAITLQAADMSGAGQLRVYDRHAVIIPGGIKMIQSGPGAIPAIADVDIDGRNEIIVLGTAEGLEADFADKLWVFDLGGGQHGPIEWGQFGGGPEHRGVYPVPGPPAPPNVPPVDSASSYLPVVRSISNPPPAMIHGKVTVDGVGVGGIPVTLRYFDGQDWMDWISLITSPGGSYHFISPASLGPDEKYMIKFQNDAQTPGLVSKWESRLISNYYSDGYSGLSTVDLADVQLDSPADSTTTSFPALFRWSRTPAAAEFLYRVVVFDPQDGSPFYQSPLLSGQHEFQLSSLPTGFDYQQSYAWSLWIYGADGSQLKSNVSRTITFSQ